jgi:hypothetical protein
MRNLSQFVINATTSGHVRPFTLVMMDFPDGPVRASSLPFDVTVDGQTYYGVSELGTVSEISEGLEQRSYGVNVTVNGIPTEFCYYISDQKVQGRLIKIGLGFLDRDDRIIGEIVWPFTGRMDTLDLKIGGKTSVSIAGETLLIDWSRPRTRTFTDADQKSAFPGDRGLEHVAEVANKELTWGRT